MTEDSDATLVRCCCEGNKRAFEQLIARYEKPVFNAAMRMLRNPDDARDVTQTAFLKVFEHIEDYDPKFRFYSWIYRIALNESINVLNRGNRFEPLDDEEIDRCAGPEQILGNEQLERSVQQALTMIKQEYRTVIVMKHFLGCSYHDMSETLDLPEKTVKSRLFTARQLLKEALQHSGLLS